MKTATLFTTSLTALLLNLSGTAMAANPSGEMPMPMRGAASSMGAEAPAKSYSEKEHMKQGGMMGGGMMGMMGSCPMMGPSSGPNGKVMMQMHGEMMRAMGDIMMKYADKFETPPATQ